jgi:hypothetical protein
MQTQFLENSYGTAKERSLIAERNLADSCAGAHALGGSKPDALQRYSDASG